MMRREYFRFRAKGWRAADAFRAAKIVAAWDAAGGETVDDADPRYPRSGNVRIRLVVDECSCIEDLGWEGMTDNDRSELAARVDRDGSWGIVGEYRDASGNWVHVDSCFGFVGDDWQDSGYDVDVMRATLDAYQAHRRPAMLAAFGW